MSNKEMKNIAETNKKSEGGRKTDIRFHHSGGMKKWKENLMDRFTRVV